MPSLSHISFCQDWKGKRNYHKSGLKIEAGVKGELRGHRKTESPIADGKKQRGDGWGKIQGDVGGSHPANKA